MDINAFLTTPTPQLADMLMQAHPNVDPTPALHALNQGGLGGGSGSVGAPASPNAGFGVAGEGQTQGLDATAAANPSVPGALPSLDMLGLGKNLQQPSPTAIRPVSPPGGRPAQFINPQTATSPANVGPARKRSGSLGDILGGLK